MDATKDKYGMTATERSSYESENGESFEASVERGEDHIKEQMLEIARGAGFDSVDAVLKRFDSRYDADENEQINRRLNSGGSNAVNTFGDLVARLRRDDQRAAQAAIESNGGCVTNEEFQKTNEEIVRRRRLGEPVSELESKILATPMHICEGSPE